MLCAFKWCTMTATASVFCISHGRLLPNFEKKGPHRLENAGQYLAGRGERGVLRAGYEPERGRRLVHLDSACVVGCAFAVVSICTPRGAKASWAV